MSGASCGQPERAGMTAETAARHPKVLIISRGAPGVGKDANSIMLWRLLKHFPANSYMVLSSSKNWPDGRVPQAQQEEGYRCFVGSVVRPGISRSGGALQAWSIQCIPHYGFSRIGLGGLGLGSPCCEALVFPYLPLCRLGRLLGPQLRLSRRKTLRLSLRSQTMVRAAWLAESTEHTTK